MSRTLHPACAVSSIGTAVCTRVRGDQVCWYSQPRHYSAARLRARDRPESCPHSVGTTSYLLRHIATIGVVQSVLRDARGTAQRSTHCAGQRGAVRVGGGAQLLVGSLCPLQCRGPKRRRDHSLGRLETIELERAVLLYRKATRRREEIYLERKDVGTGWRARWRNRAKFRKTFGAELEELRCRARDLRATIARLRGRPIRRFKFWVHLTSAKFALGCSLGCNGLLLALLIACAYYAEPLVWAPAGDASFDTFVLWQAPEGRMLLANWMAVSFGAVAMPCSTSRGARNSRTARRPNPGLAGIRRRRSGPVDRSAAGRRRSRRGGAHGAL